MSKMITHSLIQGSQEWHDYRATHDNASDAPAMMGASAYKTRNELLAERKFGDVKAVDAATQKRFDDGHRFEALARRLAEDIINDDLFPVTGSRGRLSASYDGLTMSCKVAFEHKSLNAALREAMKPGCTGLDLDDQYQIQMEQQCDVSGCEKILFMASSWGNDGELIEERHCWYYPNLDLRAKIEAGWDQFNLDVAAYTPSITSNKPKAESMTELPALFLQAKGEITSSNLTQFGFALAASLEAARNQVLITDQDFSNAEAAAKQYRETCKKLMLAKEGMLAQTITIGEASKLIDTWHEDLRVTALKLEKDVEKEKNAKKLAIVSAARLAYAEHVTTLEAETVPARLALSEPDFAGSMKGKRLISAWQDGVDTLLASAKIESNAVAKKLRDNLAVFKAQATGQEFLFSDLASILHKAPDDFAALVTLRVTQERDRAETAAAATKAAVEAAMQQVVVAPAAVTQTVVTQTRVLAPEVQQAVVVEHQDEISLFLATVSTDAKTKQTVRAYLVQFVKFQAARAATV